MRIAPRLATARAWAAACLLLSGCGTALPSYEWAGHEAAMARIVERSQQIETVAGSCRIHLHDGRSGGGSLEGALAAGIPDHLRLRAWKFGHAAFDITATPEGLWVLIEGEGDAASSLRKSAAEEIARAWSLLTGDFFVDAAAAGTTRTRHYVTGVHGRGGRIDCEIDRRTLLPLRFDYLDDSGNVRASLRLQNHQLVGEHIWPMRMAFESEAGVAIIQMRDVEINEALAPGAFRPPSRAEKLP